jgi:hypothetical protein
VSRRQPKRPTPPANVDDSLIVSNSDPLFPDAKGKT